MVEGPGCKLKGIKIKAKLRGQTVSEVRGNAVDKKTKKQIGQLSPFHQLVSRPLEDVQTLGKELFMYFGDICLRIHFLMSGQSFINNEKVDKDSGGNAETPTLELQMSGDLLTFRNASADIRPSEPCRQRYVDLNNVDVCSPIFNFRRAVTMVMEQQDRLVCDVLLDQTILPGVGNIIKNEALIDSGIRPTSKISDLKEEHIKHLVKMTRDFTTIFYECRRDGKQLSRYYKIYGKKQCKQCSGRVTICRLGEYERITYFCDVCQTNDLNKTRKLPTKNSLLGWVQTAAEDIPIIDWSCSVCTLINQSNKSNCSACLNPRISGTVTPIGSLANHNGGPHDIKSENPMHVNGINIAKLNQVEASKGTKRILAASPASNTFQQSKSRKLHTEPVKKLDYNDSVPKNIPGSKPGTANNQVKSASSQSASSIPSKIPACPTHKRKCIMREVRKKGDNLGRWFFSCVVRTCNYFEWADIKFPVCQGHGKPCTVRTVLKIGPNNGKKFFACKMPKNKQCQYFEWAVGYD